MTACKIIVNGLMDIQGIPEKLRFFHFFLFFGHLSLVSTWMLLGVQKLVKLASQ